MKSIRVFFNPLNRLTDSILGSQCLTKIKGTLMNLLSISFKDYMQQIID